MHNLFSTTCVKWDYSKLVCPDNSTTGHCTGLYDNTGIEISFANGPSRLQQPRR